MVILTGLIVGMIIIQAVTVMATFWVCTEVKAMQKSTHSIQFVPAEDKFQTMTDQVKESLNKDLFDNVG